MSRLSLLIRIACCSVVAFLTFPRLDRWLTDALFRLRGPLNSPTDLILVYVESESHLPSVIRRIKRFGPRVTTTYTAEALDGDDVAPPTLLTYHRLIGTPGKPVISYPLAIDFRGPAGSYPDVPASDLESTPRERLEGKAILVGRRLDPRHWVPTPFGPLTPLEIQANVLETLWQNRSLVPASRWVITAGTLLTTAAAVVILLLLPLSYAWLILVALALLWIGIGFWCLAQAKVFVGLANPLLSLLTTHLLLLGYKVKRQEAEYWKTKRDAEYARQLDEFKNNFVSLFSHDLKTPIARIKALVQMGLSESAELPAKTQDSFRNIDRASDELARLISDILKVTKMESMSLELHRDAVDVNRMVELAVSRLKYPAEDKGMKIVLDLEPLFPIEGDPQLIQEIILNLVENALKYGRPSTEVTIRTSEEPGGVRVSVKDQGAGIPADEVPRVTGKFYRGKDVTKSTSGSGLGLYLAKYFVEMHQGRLEIKSQVGRGTEVSFWLPSTN